ncbi:acyl-CoA dehydrogenase (plasmid) [Rhodococcus sp. USK10]|uniref:acyl-CoA dehydrogenase n=1 Tax=Rhodococcus sp. USK10 TaxID=2789739 RepID=UPI001C6024E5|nr:acyl-CoA dehydrogenase [Rhodococcus sp. USK10]QYB00268.1 acyl-CoA dehydrogenase [Rhodococcus sp. USK10]
MGHYLSNLRDIQFNLFELFSRQDILGRRPYASVDMSTARNLLGEVERLAVGPLGDSFRASDRNAPRYDAVRQTVEMNPEFKASVDVWLNAEYWRLRLPADLGGEPAPPSLVWALDELVLGSNPAVWLYTSLADAARIVWENGNARDRSIATHMIERRWGATMVLTEPEAGSDVGSARTRATPAGDGRWHIEGTKRFITGADHDLSENILHLVLARPQGVEGQGGTGTKGLSLFLVPKWHFDPETGAPLDELNGVRVTAVEAKLGMTASVTCEVEFGGDRSGPAVGYLLGEVHDGINQMFKVIENARMMVATKAMATMSTGYLNALAYAQTRVQGPDLRRQADKHAPRVAIIQHPDVRRSLLTQKAIAEGMRSLVLYTATWQDTIQVAQVEGENTELADAMNDLMLPIIKGYCSERAWVTLGTESLQTFGGSGFLKDFPLEQYVRDTKIDSLYEGTTAIQGLDLVLRKIIRDDQRALNTLLSEIGAFVEGTSSELELKVEADLLAQGLAEVRQIVAAMVEHWGIASAEGYRELGSDVYAIGMNASRLLLALGDLAVGWLLLRGARVALARVEEGTSEGDFYRGKIEAARFFARSVLPRLTADRIAVEQIGSEFMNLDASVL